jgi:uracil DNA glycosylase
MKVVYYDKDKDYNLSVDYSKLMAPSWNNSLKEFLHTDDMQEAMFDTLDMYNKTNIETYPKKKDMFKMFNKMDISDIDVLIINCEPKFNKRSNGLAFGNSTEKKGDYDFELVELFSKIATYSRREVKPEEFDLDKWVLQNVFLLNTSLTGYASSARKGLWFGFIRAVLTAISRQRQGLMVLFVGSEINCRPYMDLVSHAKHTILRHDTLTYDALNEINLEIDGVNGRNYRIRW